MPDQDTESGPLVLDRPGQLLQGEELDRPVEIAAADVTLRGLRITSDAAALVTVRPGITGARIEETALHCAGPQTDGIVSGGYVAVQVEAYGCREALRATAGRARRGHPVPYDGVAYALPAVTATAVGGRRRTRPAAAGAVARAHQHRSAARHRAAQGQRQIASEHRRRGGQRHRPDRLRRGAREERDDREVPDNLRQLHVQHPHPRQRGEPADLRRGDRRHGPQLDRHLLRELHRPAGEHPPRPGRAPAQRQHRRRGLLDPQPEPAAGLAQRHPADHRRAQRAGTRQPAGRLPRRHRRPDERLHHDRLHHRGGARPAVRRQLLRRWQLLGPHPRRPRTAPTSWSATTGTAATSATVSSPTRSRTASSSSGTATSGSTTPTGAGLPRGPAPNSRRPRRSGSRPRRRYPVFGDERGSAGSGVGRC